MGIFVFFVYSSLYAVVVAISISVPFVFCRRNQKREIPPPLWPIFAGPILASLVFFAFEALTNDSSWRTSLGSQPLESALIHFLIGFPPAILMREMYRLRIPRLSLNAQLFTLALIALVEISCSVLIEDVRISMMVSNSFATLGQFETDLIVMCMITASILATLTSIGLLLFAKQQRIFALGLLFLSAGLVPVAHVYANYVGDATASAVQRHLENQ